MDQGKCVKEKRHREYTEVGSTLLITGRTKGEEVEIMASGGNLDWAAGVRTV
jgi:hypothetical protein